MRNSVPFFTLPPEVKRSMSVPGSLCVVNGNGERYLEATLGAAYERSVFEEVLVVDNESTDDGLQLVGERFPGARILEMGDNRGPGAARNVGFRAATLDLILFVDNEVRVASDCAAFLARALEEGRGVEWIRVISWLAANSFAVSRRRRIIQRGRKVQEVDISQGVPLRFTNDLTTSAVERFFQRMLSRFFESYWRIVKEYLPWQKIVPVFFVTINEIR